MTAGRILDASYLLSKGRSEEQLVASLKRDSPRHTKQRNAIMFLLIT